MHAFRYTGAQKWGTDFVMTSGTGALFVGLNTQPADEVVLFIPASGVGIDILSASQPIDTTKYVSADAPSGTVLSLVGNTNEVLIRRTDQSSTPIRIAYTWRQYQR